ncbi:hypothetical protein B0H21DRAFT_700684, partial [Amylocystis lapponica]
MELKATSADHAARLTTALMEKERVMTGLLKTLVVQRRSIRNLKQRCHRAPHIRSKAVERAKSAALRASAKTLKAKGIYTPKTCTLVRALVHSGCSVSHVGAIMREIATAFGVHGAELKLDKRTVGRMNLEGGVASEVQIAHEIMNAESLTISGDGTMHWHNNFEARFAAIPAPSYATDSSSGSTLVPQMRLLGVNSAIDHTSETQYSGWMKMFKGLTAVYGRSPLAARSTNGRLEPVDIAWKLHGMNGDQAEDQKKTYRLMKEWKQETIVIALGSHELLLRPSAELSAVLVEATTNKLAAVGGLQAWELLGADEQGVHD